MKRVVIVVVAAAAIGAGIVAGIRFRDTVLRMLPGGAGRAPAGDSIVVATWLHGHCARAAAAERPACYAGPLRTIAADHGPREALGVLSRLTALDHEVRVRAHDYAHAIGVASFEAVPDVERTFPACDVAFQSGCYHGVIQAYFVRAAGDDSTAVRGVCASWTGETIYDWLRFQCTHGLGHGLTMRLDHDLPAALTKCDLLTDAWDRDACYSGAFMENIVDATQPHEQFMMMKMSDMPDSAHGKFKQIDRHDPAYPCSILAERYLASCWVNQFSVIAYLSEGDLTRSAAGCEKAPARYARWCFIGFGTDISGMAVANGDSALKLCAHAGTRWRQWCYVGVAKNFIEIVAKSQPGMAFCRLVAAPADKLRCYEGVGEEINGLSALSNEREQMCADAEAPYADACRFGARVTDKRPRGLLAVE